MKDSTPGKFVFNQHLDARFLDELFDGDAVYAQIVFEDFLRDLPDYWKDVDTAYVNQDLRNLRTSIHKCKTLFGYVGFSDIQQLCQEFENSCSEKTYPALEAGYRVLVQKKENARNIIETEYDRLKLFNAADS
jgi:HPt (histidine-containing phosphotransfer) domain-containing protein